MISEDLLFYIGVYLNYEDYSKLSFTNSWFYIKLKDQTTILNIVKQRCPEFNGKITNDKDLEKLHKMVITYDMKFYKYTLIEEHVLQFFLSIRKNIEDKPHFEYCYEIFEHDDVNFLNYQLNQLSKHFTRFDIIGFINIHVHLIGPKCLKFLRDKWNKIDDNLKYDELSQILCEHIDTHGNLVMHQTIYAGYTSERYTGPLNVDKLCRMRSILKIEIKHESYDTSVGKVYHIPFIGPFTLPNLHVTIRGTVNYFTCVVVKPEQIDLAKSSKILKLYHHNRGIL